MTIHIRKATMDDLDAMAGMSKIPEFMSIADANHDEIKEYYREYVEKGLSFVAEDETGIVGFATSLRTIRRHLWFDALTVKEGRRDQGIGKQLVTRLLAAAKEQGYTYIHLIAPAWRKETTGFYEKLGMEKGKEYVEFRKEL